MRLLCHMREPTLAARFREGLLEMVVGLSAALS